MQFSDRFDELVKGILVETAKDKQDYCHVLARVAVECYKLGKKETALETAISKADSEEVVQ